MEEKEIWKDIPGYEGEYQASTYGRIRSLDRYIPNYPRGTRFQKGVILKQRPSEKARKRLTVDLPKMKRVLVHKLILMTFVGPRPNGLEICHKDGDESNNRLNNLRYDTKANNQIDIYRYGKKPSGGKLTPRQVLEIRKLFKEDKLQQKVIAKQFSICQQTVSDIVTGKTFYWLDDEDKWRDVQ